MWLVIGLGVLRAAIIFAAFGGCLATWQVYLAVCTSNHVLIVNKGLFRCLGWADHFFYKAKGDPEDKAEYKYSEYGHIGTSRACGYPHTLTELR